MITSINEWRKYIEAQQINMFDTFITGDDVNVFRNNFKEYFNNGFNIKAIKDTKILEKLVISDYPSGIIIDYSAINDKSNTGILYTNVFKKLWPDIGFKSIGWQNYTIATLKHIIEFLFKKIYNQYNLNIDDMSMRNDNKMIVTLNINESVYYNSHGHTMLFSEFIELEVEDRENYEMSDIEEWMQKYNITMNSECIWVTEDKNIAKSYHFNNEHDTVVEIDSSLGFIIPESDDGDNGFLFIYK